MSDRLNEMLKRLNERYPFSDKCFLEYEKDYELLIATILSAQCTDRQVNIVTSSLFVKYPTLESFATAKVEELMGDVKSTGFFRTKARNIIASAKRLIDVYGGQVPGNMDDLLTLPGVGRKTGNMMLGHIYHIPSIVVDTHVKRIAYRLGMTNNTDPEKVERDLVELLPVNNYIPINQQLINFGREICSAKKPLCGQCFLADLCPTDKG